MHFCPYVMKKNIAKFLILVLALLFEGCMSGNPEALSFRKLTCGYIENPLGIDAKNPLFSWIVKAGGESQYQSAYHIIVASSLEQLTLKQADQWNSGKVVSSQSVNIKYVGSELVSSKKYWWKVRIWDQKGNDSGWSAPQCFETGLFNEEHWQGARWMTLKEDHRRSEYRFRNIQTQRMDKALTRTSFPSALFRKEFLVQKKIQSARAYVCGLGYCELYLNGCKIGDRVLDPAPTSYDDHALYTTYDITGHISNGKNTIGLILGNGFYGQDIAFNVPVLAYGKPSVKILVRIEYADGTIGFLNSGNDWAVNDGPIVFDNVYAGETYDASFEQEGWNETGFDDSSWQSAQISTPKVDRLVAQLLPPIKKVRKISPVGIFKSGTGKWIVDFGQNISGWIKININEEAGTVITIRTAEALTRAGTEINTRSTGWEATGVEPLDIYICKGGGWEEWEPRFTYHGFQYAEISGLTEKLMPQMVEAVCVNTDVNEFGSFECSDPMLNRMMDVSKRTVIGNLHGLPEDCPHREKCGWLGDAHVCAQFCLYSYDMALLYHKYSDDIQSQLSREQGNLKADSTLFRVPSMIAPGKRKAGIAKLDWGVAEIYIPWYIYLNYGDNTAIHSCYEEMKELVAYYLTFKNKKGIIENGQGDWCPPRWDRIDNPEAMECHPYVSANAYLYDVMKILCQIAVLEDDLKYKDWLDAQMQALKKAFNTEFVEMVEGKGTKWYGSQTGTVLALQFGLVPDSIKTEVIESLKYDILEKHLGHHSTGIHGGRYIYSLLCDLGEPNLSCDLLTTPDFPSQAYIINCGLNTWPERQWKWGSGIEWDRSLNHPMHSGFAAFFYESLAGIRPIPEQPGYKEFLIAPVFPEKLDHVDSKISSPYGEILVNWRKNDDLIEMNLEVPFNTKAYLKLPFTPISGIQINRNLNNREQAEYVIRKDIDDSIILYPGEYRVEFRNPPTIGGYGYVRDVVNRVTF